MDERENNSMSLKCPVCGSEDVKASTSQRSISAPLGPEVSFAIRLDTCGSCGEAGDFTGANDESIQSAEQQSASASIGRMLAYLGERGCTMAHMERALSLPTRTIARWKTGGASAGSLALLRMVATYPWLLEVADARFAPRIASAKVVAEASRVLTNAVHTFLLGPVASTSNLAAQFAEQTQNTGIIRHENAHTLSISQNALAVV